MKEILREDNNKKIVIVSAPGKRNKKDIKVTDLLIFAHTQQNKFDYYFNLVKQRFVEIVNLLKIKVDLESLFLEIKQIYLHLTNSQKYDYIVSRGEYIMAKIMSEFLHFNFLDSANFIVFNKKSKINLNQSKKLFFKHYKNSPVVIPGFYGKDCNGNIKLFSRGGSDLTGAIVSNLVDAEQYENYTDVDGFLSCDPKLVSDAKIIKRISYRETRELSYMGANVLHPDCIYYVKEKKIPIVIKNTFNAKSEGTTISYNASMPDIYKIAGQKNFLLFYIEKYNFNQNIDFFSKISGIFKKLKVNIKLILTSIDNLTIVVEKQNYNIILQLITYLKNILKVDFIKIFEDISLISVINENPIYSIEQSIFTVLSKNKIQALLINKEVTGVSVVIAVQNQNYTEAIQLLHSCLNNISFNC